QRIVALSWRGGAHCVSTCYQLTRGEGKPSTFHNCCTVMAYKSASQWQRENGQRSDDLLARPKEPTDQRQMRGSLFTLGIGCR
ncbi:hypothetical protein C0J52_25744, partial [Blattella germanica]